MAVGAQKLRKNPSGYLRRMAAVSGITPLYSQEAQGAGGYVDFGIASIIDDLNNRLNLPTLASCSGLPEDHCGDRFNIGHGYISFGGGTPKEVRNAFKRAGLREYIPGAWKPDRNRNHSVELVRTVWERLREELVRVTPVRRHPDRQVDCL